MFSLPVILSILPFVVFLVFLFGLKSSLLKSSLWTVAVFTVLAIFYWRMIPITILDSYIKGFFVAFDIFIIIFGAIFFLKLLEDLSVIKNISYYLEHISKDFRIQIIVLAWFFENFIEGTAGFGTPVAIVAPLLVGLGLSPIRALVIALLGNSTSVVFGAAGTPIRTGFAGLETSGVPEFSALINCIGFIVPVFMLWIVTSGRKKGRIEFLNALPFAVWSGIAFVGPSLLIATIMGQELPSILGSIIGFILIMITTKLKIFVPKEKLSLKGKDALSRTMSWKKAFMPYGLLVILLILGKLILGNSGMNFSLISDQVFKLFNPGFAFILAGLVVIIFWRRKRKILFSASWEALKGTMGPFIVIFSMSSLVQLLTSSYQNYSGLPAAISLLAKSFESSWLPFFAPFIGAFGSFVTGSATVSNIMFGDFFDVASKALNLDSVLILSLAVVGASAGNMIALADMLAGEAVVGLKNKELKIFKGVIIPCVTYLVLIGLIGLLVS